MNAITDFAQHHPFLLLFAYWMTSNFISTMPSPKSGGWTDGLGYAWAFNALHAFSGTVGRILAQYPGTAKLTGQVSAETPKQDDAPKP